MFGRDIRWRSYTRKAREELRKRREVKSTCPIQQAWQLASFIME
jgi:hypothetical protein